VTDRGIRDVERAARELGELGGAHDEPRHLDADRHRCRVGVAVDPRQLGILLVRAHRAVDATHLVHHRSDRGFAGSLLVGPELDGDAGAHDRLFALQPRASPARQEPA
jgi:hypothetical protein